MPGKATLACHLHQRGTSSDVCCWPARRPGRQPCRAVHTPDLLLAPASCPLLQAARSCKLPAPARAARCQPQCTDLNTTVLFLDSRSWSFPQVAGKGSLGKACRRGSSGGKPKM
jgi:hypothetical protein